MDVDSAQDGDARATACNDQAPAGANDEEILSVNMSAVLVVRVSVEHNTLSLSPFVPVSASSWL